MAGLRGLGVLGAMARSIAFAELAAAGLGVEFDEELTLTSPDGSAKRAAVELYASQVKALQQLKPEPSLPNFVEAAITRPERFHRLLLR